MLWLENKNINLCSAERKINSSFTAWVLANNSNLRSVYKIQSKSACDSLSITLQKRHLRSSKGIFSNVVIQFCVCFCPSVCLPVRILSVYVSVRPSVCPSVHIFV